MTGCTLRAPALAARVEEWRALLRGALIERTPTPRGLRLCFRREPAVEATLAALVAKEQTCCASIAFRTTAGEDALTLDITGAGEAVIAIRHAFGGTP